MNNMTAKVSCFARAYHYKNNSTYIFEDSAAEKILGREYDEIADNMAGGVKFFFPGFEGTSEEGLRLIADRQLSPSVLGRSAFCEEKLFEAIESGLGQYMIFAAGYDTFSIRYTDDKLSVYELDLPEMIADKTQRIKKYRLKSVAKYIPCDLAKKEWKKQIIESGYSVTDKSFSGLLGISYYLTKEEFGELLTNINEIVADDSIICFDYPSIEAGNEAKTNQRLALGAGEQMKSQYSYEEIKALLQSCGFEIAEHMDDKEMTGQYFSKYNEYNPSHAMQAPVGIAYLTAIKR